MFSSTTHQLAIAKAPVSTAEVPAPQVRPLLRRQRGQGRSRRLDDPVFERDIFFSRAGRFDDRGRLGQRLMRGSRLLDSTKKRPSHGCLVNAEYTVKSLVRRNGITAFPPENFAYAQIVMSDGDEMTVQGVVTGWARRPAF